MGAERHGRLRAGARAARRARATDGVLAQRDEDRQRPGRTAVRGVRRCEATQRLAGARGPRPLVDGTADHQPRLGRRLSGRRALHGAGPGQVPGGAPAGSTAGRLGGRGAAGVLAAAPRGPQVPSRDGRRLSLGQRTAPASLLDAGATTSRHPTRCAAILLGMSEPRAEEPTRIRVGQAAEMLGITVETLRRWETEGRLTMERSEGGASGSSRSRRSRGSSRSGDARRPRGRSSRSLRATTSRAS